MIRPHGMGVSYLAAVAATVALAGGCAAPEHDAAREMTLGATVTGWAAYEHDGQTYVHLWSPGQPKSVYLVPESSLPEGFLDELKSRLPQFPGVPVLLTLSEKLKEAPTLASSVALAGDQGSSGAMPSAHE